MFTSQQTLRYHTNKQKLFVEKTCLPIIIAACEKKKKKAEDKQSYSHTKA